MKKTIITSIAAVFLSVSVFAQGAGMRQMKNIDGKDYVAVTNPVTLVNAEAAARRAGDAGLTNYALTTATALVSAEATERIAGDSTSISFTSATSNALAAATASLVASEASARRAGDAASTNFTLSVSNSLNTSIVSLVNAEASARRAGDAASTNFTLSVSNSLSLSTSALVDTRVPTNRMITIGAQVGSLQTNLVFASTGVGVTEPTVTNIAQAVISPFTNKIETAWQNPFYATNYTWTSDGNNITLTSYNSTSGGNEVIIPRLLSGLVVENLGSTFNNNDSITSISGGENIKQIGTSAFYKCLRLSSIDLPNLVSVGIYAFGNCSIESINLPNVKSVGGYAFGDCYNLRSVYFGQNAPADSPTIYDNVENVTNYVTNPTATGWGDTFGGRPVVRMPIYADRAIIAGTNIQETISQRVEKSSGTATNLSVFSSLTLLGKTITWNTSRQTFDVPLYGGVVGQLFQEQLMLVRNQTGVNIGNGKIVCSAGSVGDNSAIRKASSSDASCAWGVLGMVTQDAGIDHGSDGLICTGGEVNNLPLPTSIYQPSNTLWLATDGNYTNVEPQNVAVKYQIGTVLRAHATKGRIQFNPQFIPSPASIGAASSSNATLTGTATINGDVIIGAGGVTNAILANQQLMENYYTKAEVDAASSAPYKAWTGTIAPANGTATVTYAHGNMPTLTITSPTYITLDPTGFASNGVSRVSLSLYSGTNAVTFNTNLITFATTPTISTNCWNSILIRRVANCIWKGVGL